MIVTPLSALVAARDQFRFYEREHTAKAQPHLKKATDYAASDNGELRAASSTYQRQADASLDKAKTNGRMAAMLDTAIEGLNPPSFGHDFADSFRTVGEVRAAAFNLSEMQEAGTPAAHLATRLHDSIGAMLRGDGTITAAQVREALQGAGDLAETAFGPADAPGLPLGLRRHPRYALRVGVTATSDADEQGDGGAFTYPDLVTLYSHYPQEIVALAAIVPKEEVVALEVWRDGAWHDASDVVKTLAGAMAIPLAPREVVDTAQTGPYRQGVISIGYSHGIDEALADVAEFHAALAPDLIAAHPRMLTADEAARRAKWIDSETRELLRDTPNDAEVSMRHAVGNHVLDIDTMAQQIDAAMDVVYFALGIPMEMGLNAAPFWSLAHGANMAKLHTDPDGAKFVVRREGDNKVVKPEGWMDPHAAIVEEIKRQVLAGTAVNDEHYTLRHAIRANDGPPEGYVDAEEEG